METTSTGRPAGKTGPIARAVKRDIKEFLTHGTRWHYDRPIACGHDWMVEYFAGERPHAGAMNPHIMLRHIEACRRDESVKGRAA